MATRGPRGRSKSVTAPVIEAATETRFQKAKNFVADKAGSLVSAVKNHPFISGGVAGTIGLLALDLATTTAKMTGADYAQAVLIAAAEVAGIEAIGYGIYKAVKAAYNNASMPSMESAKNAGKTALNYASKPFSFGYSVLSAGYNMLPPFKKATATTTPTATQTVANDDVTEERTVRRNPRRSVAKY